MNKKIAKILALVLTTAALLALAIGFSVSAEEETPTLDILSKNMSYGSNFKLAFAVFRACKSAFKSCLNR